MPVARCAQARDQPLGRAGTRGLDGRYPPFQRITLQYLEKDGFIDRVSHPVVPPHVEYSLTPLGKEIGLQVGSLADWIEINMPKIAKAQQKRLA